MRDSWLHVDQYHLVQQNGKINKNIATCSAEPNRLEHVYYANDDGAFLATPPLSRHVRINEKKFPTSSRHRITTEPTTIVIIVTTL